MIVLLALLLLTSAAGAADIAGVASVDRADRTRWDAPGVSNLRNADGTRKLPLEMTFASRSLPLGSCAIVSHNGRARLLRVADVGPCGSAHCRARAPLRVRSRVADLRPRPAVELGCLGLCRVVVRPAPCGGWPW